MDSIFFYRNQEIDASSNGHLHGLKIAIQPNISAVGWPTNAVSNALANFTALEDATIVKRLRQAMCLVMLGFPKMAMPSLQEIAGEHPEFYTARRLVDLMSQHDIGQEKISRW